MLVQGSCRHGDLPVTSHFDFFISSYVKPASTNTFPHTQSISHTQSLSTHESYSQTCSNIISQNPKPTETMPSIILNLHAKKDGKDHLTSLPVEVQQNIIGHLFCSHNPDQITTYDPEAARHDHSLDNLAATSKALRDEVMAFARTWLRRHSDITEFDKSVKEVAKVNHLRGKFTEACSALPLA